MEVDRVKVSLKYSQVLASGNTKTVELEASGTVSPKETWQQAQSYLYGELQKQVMEVFKLPEAKLEASTIRPAPPPPTRDPMDPEGIFHQQPTSEAPYFGPRDANTWLDNRGVPEGERGRYQQPLSNAASDREQPTGQHWCVRHAQQFQQHKKLGAAWWSHKVEGSEEWCRED